jgi:hypothetical protein
MPYIDANTRASLAAPLNRLKATLNRCVEGTLNYIITQLVVAYLGDQPRYANFNAAIGVLECAKLELYRRMVAPYEDKKIAAHGDVYPPSIA